MEINLKNKNDQSLVMDLKGLVSRERETLTQILHYLREIDCRQIYLARGYDSLFSWMLGELGYSEAAAYRRISAMGLIKEIPEVEENIKSGEMSLSVASQVQSYFRREDKKRKESRQSPLPKEEKRTLLDQLKGSSARECEKKLIQLNPEVNLSKERVRPLSDNTTSIQFTVQNDMMEKIELLKQLLSHQIPEGKYSQVFEKTVDMALELLDPARREARRVKRESASARRPGKAFPTSETKSSTRYLPAKLRDQIWLRDQGRCQYRNPKTGKLCGSRHALEVDHIYPFALGGENTQTNLRLVCRGHNQFRSKLLFGTGKTPLPTSEMVSIRWFAGDFKVFGGAPYPQIRATGSCRADSRLCG